MIDFDKMDYPMSGVLSAMEEIVVISAGLAKLKVNLDAPRVREAIVDGGINAVSRTLDGLKKWWERNESDRDMNVYRQLGDELLEKETAAVITNILSMKEAR